MIDYRRKVLEQSGLDPLFPYPPGMELVIATAMRCMRERDELRGRIKAQQREEYEGLLSSEG